MSGYSVLNITEASPVTQQAMPSNHNVYGSLFLNRVANAEYSS